MISNLIIFYNNILDYISINWVTDLLKQNIFLTYNTILQIWTRSYSKLEFPCQCGGYGF